MRFRSSTVALFALLAVAACSDAPTTSTLRPYSGPGSQLTLADFIQQSIDDFLPKGFEDAVEARWGTVKTKKNAGDFAGAVKHLNTLSLWIDKKTNDITAPAGMTKGQAAAMLVLNMSRWVYDGADADPEIVPTGDATIEVVPAFTPLDLATPSQHAGIEWDATASNVERIVVIVEDPTQYPGHCNGPLVTRRCQYPLFYRVESFPHTRLVTPGRFAVCMVTTGDRRPLEYLEDEPHGPVDERLRVAHNLPANEADYTPNSIQEDGIEILPLAPVQSGTVINCNAPVGMNRLERALDAVATFAAKFISPKDAYAYDQGPEHEFSFFSNFNAVDPVSQPDLSVTGVSAPSPSAINGAVAVDFTVRNVSRRSEGDATGAAVGVTARAYLSSDATLDTETDTPLGTTSLGTIRPDEALPGTQSFTLPATPGTYHVFVTVEQTGGLAEITTGNNTATQAVTVFDPSIVFESGFEATDAAWTATGFWHTTAFGFSNTAYPSRVNLGVGDLSAGALPAPFAGSFSMWYGQDLTGNYVGAYANAAAGGTSTVANSGTVSSPAFSVPATLNAVTLSFQTWFEIESVDVNQFDSLNVVVEDVTAATFTRVLRLNPATDQNGTAATPFTSAGLNLAPTWSLRSVDVSAYRGKQIRLHFRFNTRDVLYNGFRGWIIDNVLVKVQTFAAPALTMSGVRAKSTDAPAEPDVPRVWQP